MKKASVSFLLFAFIILCFPYSTVSQVRFSKRGHLCAARTPQQQAFFEAVRNGDKPLVEMFLRRGADPNATDDCGIPVIIYAASIPHPEILSSLIESGANPNTVNRFNNSTPLLVLIDWLDAQRGKGYEEVLASIKLLIENGADVNLTGKTMKSPLIAAVLQRNVPVVELLLAAGAEINFRDYKERTAYSYAAEIGDKRLKRILMNAGADLTAGVREYEELYGENAFFQASADGRTDVVEAMIAAGRDVNSVNEPGKMTALMRAYEVSTVESLLNAGADVNLKDASGFTALIWAAAFRRREIVLKLIAAGADVNARNNRGETALDLVGFEPEIEEALIKAGAKTKK